MPLTPTGNSLRLLALAVILSIHGSAANECYSLDPAPADYLTDSCAWKWSSTTDLPVSVDDCWNIITDNESLQYWYPELTVLEEANPGTVGGTRTVQFSDCIMNALSFGCVRIDELFDVWEDTGDTRRFQFTFTGINRPPCASWTAGREEFKCVSTGATTSQFVRSAAFGPGFITTGACVVVQPRLNCIFNTLSPARMLKSIEQGLLPRTARRDLQQALISPGPLRGGLGRTVQISNTTMAE